MQLNGKLRIAVQRSGRLSRPSLELLRRIGLEFESYDQHLFTLCRNLPVDLLHLRDDDIPEYLCDGVVDLGIVGSDVIGERGRELRCLLPLDFGHCALVLAVPETSRIDSLRDLEGTRIATSYPNLLGDYLAKQGISASIVLLEGSVEIAPALGVAEAVCDLVSTGSTLRTHRLRRLQTVRQCRALLVAGPGPCRDETLLERLLLRARAVEEARRYKYVMFNAPRAALEPIQRLLPSCKSPTVVDLADPGFVAVHSMVLEERFWEVIEGIHACGGRDILVSPVEKFIR